MKFSIFIIVILLFLRVKYSQSAYGQWISIQIENKAKGHVLEVKNANLDWGKWYGDSKDKEITAPTGTFAYDVKKTINSCGRSDAAAGTEGHFDIYDENSIHIARVSWDCPWGSKQNKYSVESKSTRYVVQADIGDLNSGSIGTKIITITNNFNNEDVMAEYRAAVEKELKEKQKKSHEHQES